MKKIYLAIPVAIAALFSSCSPSESDFNDGLALYLAGSELDTNASVDTPASYTSDAASADEKTSIQFEEGKGTTSTTNGGDTGSLEAMQTYPPTILSSDESIKMQSFSRKRLLKDEGKSVSLQSGEKATVELSSLPGSTVILIYLNDILLSGSLVSTGFDVYAELNGKTYYIPGTLSIIASSEVYAGSVLVFTPSEAYPAGSTVTFVLYADGFTDDGGNGLAEDLIIRFKVIASESSDSSSSISDEIDAELAFTGDGGIVSIGDENAACISTGETLVSTNDSIDEKTSTITLGPIDTSVTDFSFQYNLISEEFNEYVNSGYDDNVMLTIAGPSGSTSGLVSSINLSGKQATASTDFSISDAYETGWETISVSDISVGSPVTVTITVTDVHDTEYSTIGCIKDLSLSSDSTGDGLQTEGFDSLGLPALRIGGTYEGELEWLGLFDVYALDLSDETADVTLRFSSQSDDDDDVFFQLANSELTIVLTGDDESSNQFDVTATLSPDFYFFYIFSNQEALTPYQFKVDRSFSSPEVRAQVGKSYEGYISGSADYDIYSLDLSKETEDTEIRLYSTSETDDDVYLSVFDSEGGNILDGDNTASSNQFDTSGTLPPDTYTIYVFTNELYLASYTLHLE